ncbi:MAG: hypothetical protein ACYCS8_16285 [Acidithiobacillus sp.]
MEIMELMTQSKAVADLVWDAVKISNPDLPGMMMRHADVEEGDHHYARGILSGNATVQEVGGVLVDSNLIHTAKDLVYFLQHRVGWGSDSANDGGFHQGNDIELGIASMIQYQNRIRDHFQMGMAGERMNAGLDKLLLNFAGTYSTSRPETSIRMVQEKLDPLFEDGLHLSDHQRMSGTSRGTAPVDPQIDHLAQQMLEQRAGRISRQKSQMDQIRGPRADDPWEIHP